MKQVVIMPGGFHPFHAGHYALYKQAQDAFPGADVYVAATNDTSARPFPFAVKEKLAKLAGVKPGHFVQVKSPFQAREITANLDPENTQLIFVRSQKDANKPPQAGGVKKNGEPSYLQPLAGNEDNLLPMNQRAYMAYLPTVEFGPGMTSATEIRTAWPKLNEKRKTALVMSLYPATQKNPALAANVVKMLDAAMGTELDEGYIFKGGFPFDVDHMPGSVIRNGDRTTDVVKTKNKDKWDDMVDKINDEVFDDMSDFTTNSEGETVTGNSAVWAKWDNATQTGWFNVKGRPLKPWPVREQGLTEFAPDEGGGGRKFIPWPEFIDAVKQIVGKDFSVTEKVVKSTIQDRFITHDPMEYGPTMLYSYYEARAGRNKGAVSTRGSIQVGKYYPNNTSLGKQNFITSFNLLKGHPFERHFDLTFDNIYKIANIIMGNTEGAYQMPQQQGVAEDYIDEKK